MSNEMVRVIIAAVLLVHGLGHGGALGALAWIWRRPGSATGGWHAARSWLFPAMPSSEARLVASGFWILSLVGFVLAASSFLGILLPGEMWRTLAIVSAFISMTGILLFLGNWPVFNTTAAIVVNLAVLLALNWLNWPPAAMFGN